MARLSIRPLLPAVFAAFALLSGSPGLAGDLKLSNKWRVEVSEAANNDGTILFRVTPKDGAPVDVPVAIRKGRGENAVAKDIRDAFKATLDKDTYHSETDDGEDVLLKKRKGPDFELKFVESDVKGTRIRVEKE
jgi:hypothetical protein